MFKGLINCISSKIDETKAQYKAFGTFGLFNFPFYYFFWLYLSPETYENLFLRIICTLLCGLLVFHKKWPNKLKKYLPFYWYFTLTFTLPFFFTFMLIMNHGSEMWMTSTIIIVFFVLLLVEWVIAIILLLIGSLFGILAASFFVSEFFPASFNYIGFFTTYFVSIAIGIIFAHNKQIIEEVRRRSIKAEANSKAKSEFIANMSHDLRTPITGMLGMLRDMLNTADQAEASLNAKNTSQDTNTLRNMIETVQRDSHYLIGATDELLQLCNEILEVVRLESGKAEDNVESFDLRGLIDHNIDLLQPVAHHKNLQLSCDIEQRVPCYLKGSRIYLDRILLNLISNALKFTKEGRVTISIKLLNDENATVSIGEEAKVQIRVEDTGVGIPKDKFDTIFEHFSRLTPAYEGLYKGAGLGLYTVKRYIKAMNGNIDVNSELSKGTCFTVTLPFTVSNYADRVKQSIHLPQTVKPAVNEKVLDIQESVSSENSSATILIVEDNALAAIAVKLALQPWDCYTETAANGSQAVKMAQEGDYDLILMDIGLPDFSGIEATKKIREFSDTKKSQVPIVGLTGHANNPEVRQEAIDAGMQEALSKPAQPADVESILQNYVFKTAAQTQPTHQALTPANQPSESLAIIDWDACVRMCNDDPDFTRKMLSMLADDLKNTKNILAANYANQDTEALHAELHRSRGGLCYLKLPQLEKTLKAFHQAVNATPQDQKTLETTYAALQQALNAFWETWETASF